MVLVFLWEVSFIWSGCYGYYHVHCNNIVLVFFLKIFLGNFPFTQFEQEIRTHMNALQEKLREISREIEERNRSLEVPFTFLLPSKIPNSVTI